MNLAKFLERKDKYLEGEITWLTIKSIILMSSTILKKTCNDKTGLGFQLVRITNNFKKKSVIYQVSCLCCMKKWHAVNKCYFRKKCNT